MLERQRQKVRAKFNLEDRIRTNEKTPGSYEELERTIVEREGGKSEYGVRFDNLNKTVYPDSWWLDRFFRIEDFSVELVDCSR